MLEFSLKLLFNLVVSIILTRFIYFKSTKDNEYLFTYLVISQVVFLICYLLKNIELELGFVLGLFAIFGIIRYRTNTISIKEMTYLFSIIGLAMINSLSNSNFYTELFVSNVLVLILIAFLEYYLRKNKKYVVTTVTLTQINKLNLNDINSLKKIIENDLGICVEKINIKKVNYLTDSVEILIHHRNNEH